LFFDVSVLFFSSWLMWVGRRKNFHCFFLLYIVYGGREKGVYRNFHFTLIILFLTYNFHKFLVKSIKACVNFSKKKYQNYFLIPASVTSTQQRGDSVVIPQSYVSIYSTRVYSRAWWKEREERVLEKKWVSYLVKTTDITSCRLEFFS